MIYQSMSGDASVGQSSFTGAINTGGQQGEVYLELDGTSTWTLTGDSYVSGLTCKSGANGANGSKPSSIPAGYKDNRPLAGNL